MVDKQNLSLDEILKLAEGVKKWEIIKEEDMEIVGFVPVIVPNMYAGHNGEVNILVCEREPYSLSLFNRGFIMATINGVNLGEYTDSRIKPIHNKAKEYVETNKDEEKQLAVSQARALVR